MIYNIINKKLLVFLGCSTMKKVIAIIFALFINICFTSNFSLAKLFYGHEEKVDYRDEAVDNLDETVDNQEEPVEESNILFMVNNPYACVNGEFCLIDPDNYLVETIIIEGRTLIPLRFFAENFGFEVEWNADEYTATMVKDDKTICIKPDSDIIKINGNFSQLNAKPLIFQNRLYIPIRDINEMVGKKVFYRNGVISVTDSDVSIEDYNNNEFREIYCNFVRCKILKEHSIKTISKYEVASYFVNHVFAYYNKSIPQLDLYFFPDNKIIPKEAYYHCNLAVYLNLLKVEKADFEPYRILTENDINEVLARFEELLSNRPNLDFNNSVDEKKDLLFIISDIVKNKNYQVRVSVYDFATGETVSYNGKERFYPASLTKVANLLFFLEEVQKGNFSLNNTYTLKYSDKYIRGAKVAGTGVLKDQANGTKYTYDDILSKMISLSDNVAANIIFDALGRAKLDSFCERYQLNDTKVYKKFYDGDRSLPSNYTTTDDLTKMLVLLENRVFLENSLANQGIGYMIKTVDKARIALYAPADTVIANKIGFISRLASDMALVYFPEREPIALTIAVEGVAKKAIDQDSANKLIGTLAREIINYYRTESGPSLYIDGNLIEEGIGLRFIDGRPYLKGYSSLEGYDAEVKIIGKEKYISLDSLESDNNCTYSLGEYPQKSVNIINNEIP